MRLDETNWLLMSLLNELSTARWSYILTIFCLSQYIWTESQSERSDGDSCVMVSDP